ncbi:sugar phosphate nucleotidyltransferase [Blastopirellula marina]|uniref:Glycosyl transferase family 2 n=1 Tax=Blastopirellula marina TaxID=124 RepID=A0A2S8FNX8_9BACT|nr:NTP transferase domain-containing protein [Blastopirellula marina]PQO33883.1 glycosyl transferase family 2 [Blastopirellula marina]PTL43670.1 glycosyl transferase family 2 [Blastopirellula marina]
MGKRIAVVLAAGKGTRMQSEMPKVLFPVLGRPMIEYVLDALREVGVEEIICVVGYRAADVKAALSQFDDLVFVEQTEQLGTGHAVQMCLDELKAADGAVVVLAGDSPLVQPSSLSELFTAFESQGHACLLGTLKRDDPTGLGRIVRDSAGVFEGIVEQKDATPEQQQITEVNMSTYVFDAPRLVEALSRLTNDNAQGEYYLTDCPKILKELGYKVDALPVLKECEAHSINSREQLAEVERVMTEIGYNKN